MKKNYLTEVEIIKRKNERIETKKDVVAVEYPLTIILNDKELITLLCTPNNMEFLALGFLRSEGIIRKKEDILSVKHDTVKDRVIIETVDKNSLTEKLYGKRTLTSGCGKGTVFFNVLDSLLSKKLTHRVAISPENVFDLMRELQRKGEIFKMTGGVHSAALCNGRGILIFNEDIGRHNALDKILGEALMSEVGLEDKVIVTSGRVSSEILLKAVKLKIAVIISRSAPTSLSVELAEKLGVTLIGFVRGRGMNIYSHSWRLEQD